MNVRAESPFAAYMCTEAGMDLARELAGHCKWDKGQIQPGGLVALGRSLGVAPVASTLLVELGDIDLDLARECVEELSALGTDILVVGERTDLETHRLLRRAGAEDYFAHPVAAADIVQVLCRRRKTSVELHPAGGQIIAVTSTNGGSGASLLAQNLAATAAAAKGSEAVALVDLDFRFGTAALDLNRRFTPGLFEALAAPERIDSTFLEATMEQVAPRFSLYSAQIGFNQEEGDYEAAVPRLLDKLTGSFGTIVVDLPRDLLIRDPGIAGKLNKIVLVMPPGFSGINAFTRLAKHCANAAPEARIVPVLSDIRRDARIQRKDLNKVMQHEFRHVLPRCEALASRSLAKGQPIADLKRRSPYARAVGTLWSSLAPRAPGSARARLRARTPRP